MGWLKNIARVAAVGAAPFTGGASLAALPMINAIGAGGAALSAGSQASAQNRGSQFGGQMDLANLLMQRDFGRLGLEGEADRDFFNQTIGREQEGRAGREDAWRKLQSAQRTLSPGARPSLSPYSVAPRQATDMERQGADALSQEVMARLTGGNPIAMPTRRDTSFQYDPMSTIDPRLLKAGKGERIAGWLGAGLSGASGLYRPQVEPRIASRPQPMDERPRPNTGGPVDPNGFRVWF
jgi:hypothetical protein